MVIEHILELLAHLRELSAQPLNLIGCILVSVAVLATTIVATRSIPKLFHDIVGHCVSRFLAAAASRSRLAMRCA